MVILQCCWFFGRNLFESRVKSQSESRVVFSSFLNNVQIRSKSQPRYYLWLGFREQGQRSLAWILLCQFLRLWVRFQFFMLKTNIFFSHNCLCSYRMFLPFMQKVSQAVSLCARGHSFKRRYRRAQFHKMLPGTGSHITCTVNLE